MRKRVGRIWGRREELVIDYILGEKEIREEMGYLEIIDRIESDHHPVMSWIRSSLSDSIEEERKKDE